ncbi:MULTISPECIES: hypothetical protein [Moorena]|uniref:Uncharacterized protein n=1 Tax=Moorena producens (strain JHB) TaxID=1454205 RepID=A0A9Q9UW12_MOOP1|nr:MULTISPECIES: hypothetical protein [Moorena]NEQ12570.1 hypothetical protein [Moorena sp. SIO3E2]NEP31249.1 hypothetical protein [Moorena sp. SIO3B2]NEQ10043.1 hypothetical protein [Moorena sp. SIO4E2]NER88613.1 hypothetical protein [Moorena sp. SIO3A2]NES45924.1 hypothetical protein [Moorena sp. SIO2C4]
MGIGKRQHSTFNLPTYPTRDGKGEQPTNLAYKGRQGRTTLAFRPRYANNLTTFNLPFTERQRRTTFPTPTPGHL